MRSKCDRVVKNHTLGSSQSIEMVTRFLGSFSCPFHHGSSWGLLGDFWGAFGAFFGTLEAHLGFLGAPVGCLWGSLGRLWGAFGRSGLLLGVSWATFGTLLRGPGAHLGSFLSEKRDPPFLSENNVKV